MIKANELRLGNYVHYKRQLLLIEIINQEWITDDYTPIPITEEWLLKFGFNVDDNIHKDNRWTHEDLDFDIEVQGNGIISYAMWDSSAPFLTQFIGHCKHIHSLQNLVFAIKGEELKIKE